jgi:hypothetical protein
LEKEPQKIKTTKGWGNEEQLEKTFESVIQQMQAPKSIVETAPGSQPLM